MSNVFSGIVPVTFHLQPAMEDIRKEDEAMVAAIEQVCKTM